MPERKFWASCEACSDQFQGKLHWEVDEDGVVDVDAGSQLVVAVQAHHDNHLGHNRYDLYQTRRAARQARPESSKGFIRVTHECCPQGYLR